MTMRGTLPFDPVAAANNQNAFVGGSKAQDQLGSALKNSMRSAQRIDINASFLMESGVKLILDDLKMAAERGVPIRILTGDYLGITSPAALYMLKAELRDKADLRLYPSNGQAYHPKAYILHHTGNDDSEIYIGSSNLSRSALTTGHEWSYRLVRGLDVRSFQKFADTYDNLFKHHAIKLDDEELAKYAATWKKPAVVKDLERLAADSDQPGAFVPLLQPRGPQIEALYALQRTREEGADKALIQAATGMGKTYLAAFDSQEFLRVLFVAHRTEILQQAARAFQRVRPADSIGFFDGKRKDLDAALTFASVDTLGRPRYLDALYFAPDRFDYIVIDEYHHAVTDQYRRIADYFEPQFLLGLTATPERMDGRSVYELCDYNVPYELNLQQAINRGTLVPFHYYGIYDDTDYSRVRRQNGHYAIADLNEAYAKNDKRVDLIYNHYQSHGSERALGFCASVEHANSMAEAFVARGIKAVAVSSRNDGKYSEQRDIAVSKLLRGELQVVFCVDMFNEGIDLPSLDMVMFLRPTESPVVFLQQLGRGLRTASHKRYLTVLDFIGNYRHADRLPSMLGTVVEHPDTHGKTRKEVEYPDDCIVHFDLATIDLFKRLAGGKHRLKDRIREAYEEVKARLDGKRPTRMDLFRLLSEEDYALCIEHASTNPFRDYLGFLENLGELTEDERRLYNSSAREFLTILETTSMTKVYKMPILYGFYNNGDIRLELNAEQLLETWKAFFSKNTNWRDLDKEPTFEKYLAHSDKWHLEKMRKMPIHYLVESGKGYFIKRSGSEIALREELRQVMGNSAFGTHMKDVLDYRTADYYRRRYDARRVI